MMIGNQRLQRQFHGLLMMGIVMPETCWAVSVRQSNNILRLIVASSWVFYLTKCAFWFSLQLLSATFLILRWTERDIKKNVYRSPRKIPLFLSDFNESWIFWQFFEKYSNNKFNENPSSGSHIHCGRADMTKLSRFSQFCRHAQKFMLLTFHQLAGSVWCFL
jgi:hypothetical protein